ncbi:vascular endothelial growth factor C [Camelus ferus]|nr:vascular endothelial growth factor C [Camelus ferus]
MTYAGKDLEEQLRSASSVDELMTVLYPEYWKMYKCQLRKGGWQYNKEQANANARTEETLKFAAAHYNAEILRSIDNEWRKTQCMPREVCIDVGKEFGAATNTFFKPPCVSVYRCGGCCNSEGLQCMNTSTSYLSKTSSGKGLSPAFVLSECHGHLSVWNTQSDDYLYFVLAPMFRGLYKLHVNLDWKSVLGGFHDVCGPRKELDEETCQCVCRGGPRPPSCGPHRELDRHSCQCVCKNRLFPSACGANREFDENTCQCVCKRTCPRNQPLNPGKCVCECTETPQKCFLKGKKFQHQTCREQDRSPANQTQVPARNANLTAPEAEAELSAVALPATPFLFHTYNVLNCYPFPSIYKRAQISSILFASYFDSEHSLAAVLCPCLPTRHLAFVCSPLFFSHLVNQLQPGLCPDFMARLLKQKLPSSTVPAGIPMTEFDSKLGLTVRVWYLRVRKYRGRNARCCPGTDHRDNHTAVLS